MCLAKSKWDAERKEREKRNAQVNLTFYFLIKFENKMYANGFTVELGNATMLGDGVDTCSELGLSN